MPRSFGVNHHPEIYVPSQLRPSPPGIEIPGGVGRLAPRDKPGRTPPRPGLKSRATYGRPYGTTENLSLTVFFGAAVKSIALR